jgi:hypothetical protein
MDDRYLLGAVLGAFGAILVAVVVLLAAGYGVVIY